MYPVYAAMERGVTVRTGGFDKARTGHHKRMLIVAAGSAGYLTFAAIVTRTWRAPSLDKAAWNAGLALAVMVLLGTLTPIGSVWDGAFTALGILLIREGLIQGRRVAARLRAEHADRGSDLRPPARGSQPAPARAVITDSGRR